MRRVRSLTGEYRQLEDGVIETSENGVRSVRVGGRAHSYKGLGAAWLDADNHVGDVGRLAFAYGDPRVPIFFDRATKPKATKAPPSSFTPVKTSNWICEHADFMRSSSWTDSTFNHESMAPAEIPTGGSFDRWGSNRVEIDGSRLEAPREPGTLNPRAYWYYDNPEAQNALGITNGTLQAIYDARGEEDSYEDDPSNYYTVTYTVQGIDSASPRNSTIVSGKIFAEIEYSVLVEVHEIEVADGSVIYEDTYQDLTDPATILFALDANPGALGLMQVQWSLNLTQIEVERHRLSDILVAGGRVAIFFDGPYLYHVDAETGENIKQVDLSAIELSSNTLSTLTECVGNRWLWSFSGGNNARIWFGGDGVGVTCVDLKANKIVWTLSPSSNDTVYHPIGLAPYDTGKFNLICASERRLNEQITNLILSLRFSPTHTPEVVTQLRAGLSHLAGVVALNLDTGEEVGFTAFPGQEANGTRVAPFTDYWTSVTAESGTIGNPSWVTFPNPTIDPYDPNLAPGEPGANPGDPGGGPFGREVYQPPTDPHYRGYSGNPLDTGWIVPPSFADYYIGELPAESYQSTNATGTHIEGPRNGDDPGNFGSVDSLVFVQPHNPFGAADPLHGQFEDAVSALTTEQDGDGLNNLRKLAAAIETEHRRQNGDWVRADIARFRVSPRVAMWTTSVLSDPSPHISTSANAPTSSDTEFTWELVNKSTLEATGNPPASPSVTRRKNELGTIIDSLSDWQPRAAPFTADISEATKRAFPDLSTPVSRQGWSEQYAAWQESRTDIDTPADPWFGAGSSGATTPGTGGGTVYSTEQVLIWRPKPVTSDRFKTPAPPVTIGPTCMTGRYLVLGPRFKSGENLNLHWQAYDGNGALAWTQEIQKPGAFPGNPIAVGLADGRVGVVTFYNHGGTHFASILDGDSGEVLHDDEVVTSSPILNAVFGDGTFWSQESNTGITSI